GLVSVLADYVSVLLEERLDAAEVLLVVGVALDDCCRHGSPTSSGSSPEPDEGLARTRKAPFDKPSQLGVGVARLLTDPLETGDDDLVALKGDLDLDVVIRHPLLLSSTCP